MQPVVKFGLAALAVALLGAIAWYSSRGTATPAAPPQTAQVARPQNATHPVTAVPAATSTASDAGAPPLEETLARTMPAIVMVEAATTRGSGFFASPDLIVTDAHVISGSPTAVVTTRSGDRIEAKVVIVAESRGVALLQIPRQNARAVAIPLGLSSQARIGQGVIAMGWTQGTTQTAITRGVITALRRDGDRIVLQTDAVPNAGDSGGPLLDLRGNVLGITTSRADTPAGTAGFAIGIDDAKPLFERVPPNAESVAAVPVAPATAPSAVATAAASAAPSAVDARRTTGQQHYDEALASIETSAGQLDVSWKDYRKACQITSVPGGQSHEWFALYDPRSPLHNTGTNCADYLAQIEQRVRTVDSSMSAAAELARQSGVYAGDLRALRARHHLDYAAWDR